MMSLHVSRWRGRLFGAAVAAVLMGAGASAAPLDPQDFTSLGTLSIAGGSFTIDTDALTIVDDAAPGVPLFTGVVDDQDGTADSTGGVPGPLGIPEIAVFAFDAITLDPSATVTVTGTRALALLSHGDALIGATLMVDGAGVFGGSETTVQAGGPGGFAGGTAGGNGVGPGAGGGVSGTGIAVRVCGGSGGFGAAAETDDSSCELRGSGGASYGDLVDGPLQGGSGGGSADDTAVPDTTAGGGGGGALEVAAVGTLTLSSGAALQANGGSGQVRGDPFNLEIGGGGSGGAIRLGAAELVLAGALRVNGGPRGFFGLPDLKAGAGGRVHLEGIPGLFEVGGASASVVALMSGIEAVGGPHGVVSVAPLRTMIPSSGSVELGSRTILQVGDQTQPTVELVVGATLVVGEASVPAGGIDLARDLELDGLDARVTGTDPLTLSATLEGRGEVQVAVTNSADGRIVVVGDELIFTQAVTNQVGGQVSVVNGTIGFPGDGVSNDDGLVNESVLNLTNAVVDGDVRSPAGSTINVAGSVVFNGHVSGAGTFSGTTNQVVFNGGYAPGD